MCIVVIKSAAPRRRLAAGGPHVVAIAEVLLSVWPESVQLANNAGLLPLHEASRGQAVPVEAIKLLLERYRACCPLHVDHAAHAARNKCCFV